MTPPLPPAPTWIRPGIRVVYSSSPGHDFLGTVATEPLLIGGVTWVVHLRDMDPHYRDGKRSTVPAAACDRLREASAFDVAEFEKRVPLKFGSVTTGMPSRLFQCCICEAPIECPVMTTPDPECPEMFQLPPDAWVGLWTELDGTGRALHVCGKACLDRLMAEGWCQ